MSRGRRASADCAGLPLLALALAAAGSFGAVSPVSAGEVASTAQIFKSEKKPRKPPGEWSGLVPIAVLYNLTINFRVQAAASQMDGDAGALVTVEGRMVPNRLTE